MDPMQVFQQRCAQFQAAIKAIQNQLDTIAFVRLAVFMSALGLEILSWSWGGAWWLLCLIVGLVSFGLCVKWNEHVKRQLRYQKTLLRINVDEIKRLEGKFSGFEEGLEFVDAHHPYSSDLDLFGKHSLFQLASRASTVFGRRKFAGWLLGQSDRVMVLDRQASAEAIASQIDWRQTLQASGEVHEETQETPEGLAAWIREPGLFATRPFLLLVPWILMPLMAVEFTLEMLGILPNGIVAAFLILNAIVNGRISKRVGLIQSKTEQRSKLLDSWSKVISQIESLQSGGPAFDRIQARLLTQGRPASAEIARLKGIVNNLEFRTAGLPHAVLNTLFFWDIFCVKALEKWKAEVGEKAMDWLDVIGEAEAVNSLAALRFAFPDWSNPEVVDGPFLLDATGMGHPLIPALQRVANPISLDGNGTIWLVTGSNMSGKSTYLRTAGINVVLALAGAPVCAQSMRLSPMQVATSMRTIDSLEENTSSFYAELKRLKSVIDIVRTEKNVFFLLDEILKGTNSRDRQAGARALVEQLHKLGGAGLVSTHDIELVDMAAQLPLAIHNYSFNCTVSPEGQLDFDYRLTDGQCLSMNATALMRAMGIEV